MERLPALLYQVEHEHSDGSWNPMQEDRSHHDAAAHDPERGWFTRVLRCTACGQGVRVRSREEAPAPDAE